MRILPTSFPIVHFLRPVGLGMVSLMLSGCFYANTSQAPIATTYPYTEQQRMQAAHHWDVLARHEATQILQRERVRFHYFRYNNNIISRMDRCIRDSNGRY